MTRVASTAAQSVNEIKRLRESEVAHGRVAMAAVAGILLQEAWHPIFPAIQGMRMHQLLTRSLAMSL
jgi:hypothetical protein